jgi:hypothetical protein
MRIISCGALYLELFFCAGRKYVALNADVVMQVYFDNNLELLKKMISSRPEKLFAEEMTNGFYCMLILWYGVV